MKSLMFIFLLVISTFQTAFLSGQDVYASAMNRVDDEYTNGDYATALQDAHLAVSLRANDYKAHYYLGLIYLKLEHAKEAYDEATLALSFATGDAKPLVQKLLDLATSMNNAASFRDSAKSDEAAGLRAKAAAEYEQAFILYPRWSSLGVTAANLFGALGDLPNQADTLRRVSQAPDADAAKQASQWLTASHELLVDEAGTYRLNAGAW